MEGNRLKFALRAVANQRHAPRIGTRQRMCCHERGGASAHRCGEGQFRQQHRIAGVHVGEHAKRHHGVQALRRVARVTVDVLECVALGVGDRHQLNHANVRMVSNARRLVKVCPANEVRFNRARQLPDELRYTDLLHQP